MKLSDIDFSALANMVNSLSEEEKESLDSMAHDMLSKMNAPQAEQPEAEEVDFYEGFGIDPEECQKLPGETLSSLEAAWDLKSFYDLDKDADYSASVLFLSKALLQALRKVHYPVYKNVLSLFQNKSAAFCTLSDFASPLMDSAAVSTLCQEGFGAPFQWEKHKQLLIQMQTLLMRAEFDTISLTDLESLERLLFQENGLLHIYSLI